MKLENAILREDNKQKKADLAREKIALTREETQALENDGPKVHAHVVVGKRDGSAYGGHLVEAHVRPTLEVLVVESPRHLQRRYDSEAHLALIRLDRARERGR